MLLLNGFSLTSLLAYTIFVFNRDSIQTGRKHLVKIEKSNDVNMYIFSLTSVVGFRL